MSNVDRAKLNALLPNLTIGQTALPQLRSDVFSEIYDLLALRAAETDVLLKTNTTAYTPAQPNNPSTKQYVDDTIVSQTITKTNTAAFTPSANYQPSTKKYTDDAINAALVGVVGTPIIKTGTSFPLTPTEGQSFFKTDELRFYVFAASQWNASASLVEFLTAQTNLTNKSIGSQIYAYKNYGGL